MDFSGLNGLIPLNKHEILKRISQEEIASGNSHPLPVDDDPLNAGW
jgi:hypothetical protein